MTSSEHPTISRFDYTPPSYLIDTVDLQIQHFTNHTDVTASCCFRENNSASEVLPELVLQGEHLELLHIAINDQILAEQEYQLNERELRIQPTTASFHLKIITRIYPDQNTALEGLYRSNGNYCTQCEAEGFRRITYYLDRPDVLAVFSTRIEADQRSCPVLLANGNLVETGELPNNRHFAVWHDPFPKPAYLFATVAGQLVYVEDWFTTMSGRSICLRIYVEERNIKKCAHAMRSLQKAMRWDEEVYGREYDLDIFMIVAVDDFNMGAMENKGLNIFNSKNILALPATATDNDYRAIEGVVAHEYFHNWTGNRVTCRDWFQLSLKEGLTVFRDQEFSADMNSRPVQRIDDVRILRAGQFREDASPMAHPVRPDSYVEINNFYTATVYNKGAEVIRMLHTMLGKEGFRRGMDMYFARHDGQAVTCDDFLAAMQDANENIDLWQFSLWYSQAGTPRLTVHEEYDAASNSYSLTIEQACPSTPSQPSKKAMAMPLAIGLLKASGQPLLMDGKETQVLQLTETSQCFRFSNIPEKPVLSFLRNFSAPVIVESFQRSADLLILMAHDSDLFNRWEAASRLAEEEIFKGVASLQQERPFVAEKSYLAAMGRNLEDSSMDPALLALTLQLPPESYLATKMTVVDPEALFSARQSLRQQLALVLHEQLLAIYRRHSSDGPCSIDPAAMGSRSLKNVALSYLALLPERYADLCVQQYQQASNMTDSIAALQLIADSNFVERSALLADFANKWRTDPLVMDKWFTIQAIASKPETLAIVRQLLHHPAFSLRNPNKVRALIGAFGTMNHFRFHDVSGDGYRFLTEQIIALNSSNPQIAARLLTPLVSWKRYDGERQILMRDQLERILRQPQLSRDVYEIVKKSI